MNDHVRRFLSGALIASATVLAASCSLWPSPKYELEIGHPGDAAADLQTLYVIVSTNDVVEEAISSNKYEDLVDEKLSKKYTSFVVYGPQGDSWKEEQCVRKSKFVTHEIDEDTIRVKVNHDLLDSSESKEFVLVVLALIGGELMLEKVDHAVLDDAAEQVIDLHGGVLTLRND